jgi:hypothetical protein
MEVIQQIWAGEPPPQILRSAGEYNGGFGDFSLGQWVVNLLTENREKPTVVLGHIPITEYSIGEDGSLVPEPEAE